MTRNPRSDWTEHDTLLRGEHHCVWWLAGANVRLTELRPQLEAADALAACVSRLISSQHILPNGQSADALADYLAARDAHLTARDAHLTDGEVTS